MDTADVSARTRQHRKTLHCAQCQYDLRGQAHDDQAKCPECGMSVAASRRQHARRQRENSRLRTAVFIAIGLYIVIVVVVNLFDWHPRVGMLILMAIAITVAAQLLLWYDRAFNDYWPFRRSRR